MSRMADVYVSKHAFVNVFIVYGGEIYDMIVNDGNKYVLH